MRTTVTSWQIMNIVVSYTVFLRGPFLDGPLPESTSRLDGSESNYMMIQAASNLENILEQKAELEPSDFDCWLIQL